ncbi:hypothetical protein WME90_35190 [Sorangium sp. So ce375]|uniref:hypothetical protein n=1 Tax=Sorangium sp. So ce375 TaxID=3133306 RepID=UPI003F5B0EDF
MDIEFDPFDFSHVMYGTGATIHGTEDLTRWDNDAPVHLVVMAKGIEETAVLGLVSPSSSPATSRSGLTNPARMNPARSKRLLA